MNAQPNSDLPPALLKVAETLTLADLLTNSVTQCWAVSMIANVLRTSKDLDVSEAEELQVLRLYKVNQLLDHDLRLECFHECHTLIQEHRQPKAA